MCPVALRGMLQLQLTPRLHKPPLEAGPPPVATYFSTLELRLWFMAEPRSWNLSQFLPALPQPGAHICQLEGADGCRAGGRGHGRLQAAALCGDDSVRCVGVLCSFIFFWRLVGGGAAGAGVPRSDVLLPQRLPLGWRLGAAGRSDLQPQRLHGHLCLQGGLPDCATPTVPLAGLPHVNPAHWVQVDWGSVKWLPFLNVMFWNLNYWDSVSTLAGEVANPSRTFPRALFGETAALGGWARHGGSRRCAARAGPLLCCGQDAASAPLGATLQHHCAPRSTLVIVSSLRHPYPNHDPPRAGAVALVVVSYLVPLLVGLGVTTSTRDWQLGYYADVAQLVGGALVGSWLRNFNLGLGLGFGLVSFRVSF